MPDRNLSLSDLRPLRLLVVEDSEHDAALEQAVLRRAGLVFQARVVSQPQEIQAALAEPGWDAILSDYHLPGTSGMAVLQEVRSRGLDVPFIFVSGTLGEDRAVDAVLAGASDFVVKDRLERLIISLRREVTAADARRKAGEIERALRLSEDRYRGIFDSTPVGLVEVDLRPAWAWLEAQGYVAHPERLEALLASAGGPPPEATNGVRARSANGAALRLFHAATVEALTWPHSGSDAAGLGRILLALARRQELVDDLVRLEHPGGEPIEAVVNARLPRDADGLQRTVFAFVDVTQQHRMAEQMRTAQRLEVVGRLAGGVAHDFNNVLTVQSTLAALLARKLPPGHAGHEALQAMHDAIQRGAALSRQLLIFSRTQQSRPQIVDLGATVREIDRMLRRLIGEDIELKVELTADDCNVWIDASQLEQVLMNLAVNSRDAMPGGGQLRIGTSVDTIAAGDPRLSERAAPGSYVRLAVSDTGCGMDPATAQRAFEPFFTTKPTGKGTGLGLATVQRVMQEAGGFVTLASTPGGGTTVECYLPRRGERPERATTPPPAAANARWRGTVLLVEDEELVRRATRALLVESGFEVVAARNGEEALSVAAAHLGRLALVLTDVVMPGMGGPALVAALRRLRPALPAVYMSGYLGEEAETAAELQGALLLSKPFTLRQLGAALDQCLGPAAAAPGAG